MEDNMANIIIKRNTLLDACKEIANRNNMTVDTILSTEKSELTKDLKQVKKTLEYVNSHLFIAIEDKKTENIQKVPATGTFSDNVVFLNIDGNSYVAICDNGKNGCFVRTYARCSEKSSSYYWKSNRAKKCENVNKSDAEMLVDGMAFSELMDRVKVCKGFKVVGKSKRLADIETAVLSKAKTVANKKSK